MTVVTIATGVTEVLKNIVILTIKIVVVFTTKEGGGSTTIFFGILYVPSSSKSLVVGWSVHFYVDFGKT